MPIDGDKAFDFTGNAMSFWLSEKPLLLASKSVARQALLRGAGIPFEAVPADLDERQIERDSAHDAPDRVALHLAQAKAMALAAHYPDRIVVGADQTLALEDKRFSKPDNRAQAHTHLAALSGKTHHLHAAFALVHHGRVIHADIASARLTMRVLSDEFIANYLDAAGEAVFGSVGAYQLEGLGVHLFEAIEGDHSTILGLPLMPLLKALRDSGFLLK